MQRRAHVARTRKSESADPLASLPAWARKLAQAYYTKTVSTFLLHGSVRDLQPLQTRGGCPHLWASEDLPR